jgi:hypothetical protein
VTGARVLPAGSAALLLALAACAPSAPPGPVPLSVAPAEAPAAAATPIEIAGVGFDADVKTDYGGGGGSSVRTDFVARLVPWDGSAAVDLGAVALTARRTLTAVVPPGLAPGRYDLALTDPSGRSGRLPDAFRVLSTPADVVAFRIDPLGPQRAEAPFAVPVAAVDALGRVVSAYTASVSLQDATATATPATVGPFALGRATPAVRVDAARAANRIVVDDGAGHTGTSNDFDVAPGAPAAIAFAGLVAASASACGTVDLELRTAGGQPAPAGAAVAVALESGPPGALAFFSDASCTAPAATLAIPAGATGASFHVRGAAPGAASLRAVPDLLPSAETAVVIAP